MAILKTNKYNLNTVSVFEDPIPTSNYIYFMHDAYNKTTFAPQFDTAINHSTTGTAVTAFGYAAGASQVMGGTIMTLGNVTHVNHTSTGTQDVTTNLLDWAPFCSMDTTRPFTWMKYYNDGTNVSVFYSYMIFNGGTNNGTNYYYVYKLNPGTDLTKTFPTLNTTNGATQLYPMPVYINPTTKNLIFLPMSNNAGAGYYTGWRADGYHVGTLGTGTLTFSQLNVGTLNQTVQFLGVGNDGYARFLGNNIVTDYQQNIWLYNDSNTTQTSISAISTVPTAGGSSVGGNRALTFGSYFAKTASTTFQDPLLGSGTQGFYLPYFDTSGNYVPFYFQWTVATNTVNRNTNITVNWGARTQATTWSVDTLSSSNQNNAAAQQRVVHNETFTYTSGGVTTRYLTLMQLHGAGFIYDNYPLMRTFVTFTSNSTNPLSLTYHSSVTIPTTPKNIVWLNTTRTLLGVFAHNYFYTYSFTAANGWTLTGTLPYQYWAAGTDSTGRIWAVDRGLTTIGQIHVVTLSVPITVSVVPAQTTYNYTGTTISSTLAVSAYDQNGSRISTQVKLVIDGGSMTFGGNNLTTTITTSASADVSVAISITDGGYSNIIASVVLS